MPLAQELKAKESAEYQEYLKSLPPKKPLPQEEADELIKDWYFWHGGIEEFYKC